MSKVLPPPPQGVARRDETAFLAPLHGRFPGAPAGLLPFLTPAVGMWMP